MINRKFINFKTYRSFAEKMAEIPEDSIVFIQDKACIWARGKEYICEGPIVTSVKDGTLTFKHGNDKIAFKFSQEIDSKDGTGKVTVEDSEGNKSSATYVLEGTYKQFVTNVNSYFNLWLDTTDDFALKAELADVAFSGDYNDLSNTPNPLVIDSTIADTDNAVKNRAINDALKLKADKTDLDTIDGKFSDYLTKTEYQTEKESYIQELFKADYGLEFFRDNRNKLKLKTTLDTTVYVIVGSLEEVIEPDPNKIYLVESQTGVNGTYRYQQWRYKNGQWVSFDMALPTIDLSGYYKEADAIAEHQVIRELIAGLRSDLDEIDLSTYAIKATDVDPIWGEFAKYATTTWITENFQPKFNLNDYATKNWVETYFVQKIQVYYPKIGEWGTNDQTDGTGSTVTPVILQITVDRALSLSSPNPVENSVITQYVYGLANSKAEQSALDTLNYTLTHDYATKTDLSSKVESSTLTNYATLDDLSDGLDTKQDTLTAGNGILIINNEISTTLDTRVFIFVTGQLPSTGIQDDKIYILETIDPNDNSREYTQWRHDSSAAEPWIMIGSITPETSFEGYLTAELIGNLYLTLDNARSLYQPKASDYARTSDISNLQGQIDDIEDDIERYYQPKGNYATTSLLSTQIENVQNWAEARFQRTGGYALASDVSAAFTTLLGIIDQKYVLKRDVYNPTDFNGWSTTTPSNINISPSSGDGTPGESGGGSSAGASMMTLTVEAYEYLVSTNAVNENTYYFTYEEEEETSNWGFGDQFPVILTDGSTPDSIGTFPINLV